MDFPLHDICCTLYNRDLALQSNCFVLSLLHNPNFCLRDLIHISQLMGFHFHFLSVERNSNRIIFRIKRFVIFVASNNISPQIQTVFVVSRQICTTTSKSELESFRQLVLPSRRELLQEVQTFADVKSNV